LRDGSIDRYLKRGLAAIQIGGFQGKKFRSGIVPADFVLRREMKAFVPHIPLSRRRSGALIWCGDPAVTK
jgi:hypothetical protein